ncbi:TIR domain-containing protein [Amycolatopsis sulphurea]|uniref:TIR domain-containing protein n=1 Tax=Amycolatopsis sulphurea TaxID=76022 RepID=A0A2A9F7X9_9PSEU|nr:TIR domain-containing protein [Amycolatopsis sulphurea]PFG46652.1 TIR domain-containing protein [Amycolatopsis sulphurea]
MPEIFMNYRTGDGEKLATIIDRDLCHRFGDEYVFRDHRSIPAGASFPEVLENGVWGSKVLLCVIGARWLTAADAAGRRRIDDPQDWIHRELVLALEHGVRVIPILDEGAPCPLPMDQLPKRLAVLANLHYRTYRDPESEASLEQIALDLLQFVPNLRDRTKSAEEEVDRGSVRSDVRDSGRGAAVGAVSGGAVHVDLGDRYQGGHHQNSYHGDVFGGSKFTGPANTGSGTFLNLPNGGPVEGGLGGESRR